MSESACDALLIVSFGGPNRKEDVIPFLENVTRGRDTPRERLLEVAEHYYLFGGRSPINYQNRDLIRALREEFERAGMNLPIYWGNRNWQPFLADTLGLMKSDGVKRALAFVTSAFSSYSGCRQYREDIARALALAGEGAPEVHKLRGFFNHPGFIETMAGRVADALSEIPEDRRASCPILFTAHSIPLAMSAACDYVAQLEDACRLVGDSLKRTQWRLVYQSRSGPPSQPWLEPDIGDALRELHAGGGGEVVVVPIGFISDHMEVAFDLDTEALALARELGIHMVRAPTAGTHPKFIAMIVELIRERMGECEPRSVGRFGPRPHFCPENCCAAPARPA